MLKLQTFLAGAAACTLILSACGGDDDAAAVVTDDATAPGTSDDAAADEGAGGGPQEAMTLEVVAVDYAFQGLPDAIDAGTKLALRNDAEAELHELVAFRLADDEDRTVEEIMGLAAEEMQAALGPEPTTVILAPPASAQIATPIGDGTLDEPGRYAIICLIPTGADADEYLAAAATSEGPPDVDGGPPHIAHGMYAELEVG